MANFEELKRKATEMANEVFDKSSVYAKSAVEKAKILGKIAKLHAEIAQEKENAKKEYIKIGKAYYELHKDEPDEDMAEAVGGITIAVAAVEAKTAEIAELKASLSAPVETAEAEEEPAEEPEEEAGIVIDVEEHELTPADEEPEIEVEIVVETAEEAPAETTEE